MYGCLLFGSLIGNDNKMERRLTKERIDILTARYEKLQDIVKNMTLSEIKFLRGMHLLEKVYEELYNTKLKYHYSLV